LVFYVGFLALFVYLLVRNREAVDILRPVNIHYFLFALALSLAIVAVQGLVNTVTFSTELRRVGLREGIGLAAINTIGNYLPFSGGLVAKGVILKRRFQVGYTHVAVITLLTAISAFTIGGLAGLACTLAVKPDSGWLLGGFGLMAAGGAIALAAPRMKMLRSLIPPGRLALLDRLWAGMASFASVAWKILALNLILLLLMGGRFVFAYRILGEGLDYVDALLLNCGNQLVRAVPFAPGGIGVREAIVAILARLSGVHYELAILAAGVDRLAHMVTVFLTYGLTSWQRKR
jgi:uncharacterized membrane protein YbhN (UPF0104 family)